MSFNVGKRFKELRLLLGLSQVKMAEKASIDDKYYGRLERNESIPTIALIEKICQGLSIPLIQFFMPASRSLRDDPYGEYNIQKAQADIMLYDMDLHFNKDSIIKGCSNCIWYSGYIASAFLDEYEIRLTADGTIRAKVYENFEEVAAINTCDAAMELMKFFKNDDELNKYLVKDDYSFEQLQKFKGKAVFVSESNWLTLSIIDRNTDVIIDEFPLDSDSIFAPFSNGGEDLAKYIFSMFCKK